MSQCLQDCNLLPVVAYVLERIVAQNERSPHCNDTLSVYHAVKAPSINLLDYLQRIVRYLTCGNQLLVASLIYIDRAVQNSHISITSLCVHRVLLTSVLLAIKFLDDHFYTNAYMAKVGGVTTKEMNRLELDFLQRVDFRLNISNAMFDRYCNELARHAAAFPSPAAQIPNVNVAAAAAPTNVVPSAVPSVTAPIVWQPQQQQQQQQQPRVQQTHRQRSQSARSDYRGVSDWQPQPRSYHQHHQHHHHPYHPNPLQQQQQQQQHLAQLQMQQQQQQQQYYQTIPQNYHVPSCPTKYASMEPEFSQPYYVATEPSPPHTVPAVAWHPSAQPTTEASFVPVSTSLLRAACEKCVTQEVHRKHLSPSIVRRAVDILDEEQRKTATFDGSAPSYVLHDACARLVQEQHLSPSLIHRADTMLRNSICGY